jgi:hypothetical protein
MSDLSNRLIDAATQAIRWERNLNTSADWSGDEWEPAAKAATIAVLRELATQSVHGVVSYSLGPMMTSLADEVSQ